MDCRRFKRLHSAFLDDTLSGVQMAHMREHAGSCGPCADHDRRVRRALMLVRSAPAVVPSDGFSARLADRLARERALPPSVVAGTRWRRSLGASAAVVLLGLGGAMAVVATQPAEPVGVMAMAPIIVRPPVIPAEPVATPAMFATVSSGLPVYPAVLLARRASEHFAARHASEVTFQASR